MTFITFILQFLLLATAIIAIAVPTPVPELNTRKHHGTKKASIRLHKNPKFHGKNGTRSLIATYQKFGAALPKPLAAVASNITTNSTTSTGAVIATPNNDDLEYLAPVSIGGQTRKYPLLKVQWALEEIMGWKGRVSLWY